VGDDSDAGLGLVLRATPYRDADLVVSLYLRGRGRISGIARGARRSRKRFAGALDLLVLSRFDVRPPVRGELWSIESADVVREWTALAGDIAAFAHASYALELCRELTPQEAIDPAILDLTIAILDNLAAHGASPAALRAFELGILEAIGSAPALTACAACGDARDIDASGTVFDPVRGGVVCARCAPASRGVGVRRLGAEARRYLAAAAMAESPADAVALDAAIDPTDRIAARDAVLGMIGSLVGRSLRSVEFIAKLAK
jgi:DNA repair protein RecO (recombination protein O)